MRPLQALSNLSLVMGYNISTVTCSEHTPVVAMHINDNGTVRFEKMEMGETIEGFPRYHRTSSPIPRVFRDNLKYTIGEKRQHTAAVVAEMVKRHPRSKGLKAFLRSLGKNQRVPKWLEEIEDAAVIAPFYKGKLLFKVVAADIEDLSNNPYRQVLFGETKRDTTSRIDIVTGKPCIPESQPPPRTLNLGDSKGTTLMSVNDPTTWTLGIQKGNKHLRAPMGMDTMCAHVAGLQWLVDNRTGIRIFGSPTDEGAITYFVWEDAGKSRRKPTPSGPCAEIIRKVLFGKVTVDEIENALSKVRSGNLCVLGISAGKRLQYVGWSFMPMKEALTNVLNYARDNHRPNGEVICINDAVLACAPYHFGLKEGAYSFKRHRELGESRLSSSMFIALIDHMIEGTPFPYAIRRNVRFAYTAHDGKPIDPEDLNEPGTYFYHSQNQEALLE